MDIVPDGFASSDDRSFLETEGDFGEFVDLATALGAWSSAMACRISQYFGLLKSDERISDYRR
jgi:hypothetical protein